MIKAGDWRQIHGLATNQRFASETFPADVAPKVNEAITRVEHAQLFEEKLNGGNLAEIAKAYRPELLDDWLDPALVARGRQAKLALGLMAELTGSEQKDPTGRALVAVWDQRGRELQGIPGTDAIAKKVELWRKRIAAAAKIDQVVGRGASEREIVEAWQELDKLGGHPDAEPHRGRADKAADSLKSLDALGAVPQGEDQNSDLALLKTWKSCAQSIADCAEAAPFRERVRAATARVERLRELKKRIEAADQGQGSEKAVIEAAQALPPKYGASYAERIRQARERVSSSTALDQALAASEASDVAIAAAAERSRAGGTWPVVPEVAARCELAIRRRDLLRVLDSIEPRLPLDEQDSQWAASWDDHLLGGCHDAREHRVRYSSAVARIAAFADLEQGLDGGDAIKVKRLARDPILADHPGLLQRLRLRSKLLIAKSEQVERLLAAARSGQAEAFLADADPGLLGSHAAEFDPYRARITSWIDQRLERGDIFRAADPMFLPDVNGITVTARWAWATSRLVKTCLVASDTRRFLERPEDANRGTVNLDPDTHRRSKGGATFGLPPGCRKLYITVWPVVDLGWERRIGPPFRVGPYNSAANGKTASPGKSGRIRTLLERLLNW